MSAQQPGQDGKPLQPRHWALGGALAATVGATLWAGQLPADSDVVVTASAGQSRPNTVQRAVASAASPVASAPAVDWTLPVRGPWQAASGVDLAAWMPLPPPPPPPAPPPPPVPPPPPTAPAFPYQFIGRLTEGAMVHALLGGSSRTLAVKSGDVIDGQWKVEQIDGSGLVLTWQPAHLRQTIAFQPAP